MSKEGEMQVYKCMDAFVVRLLKRLENNGPLGIDFGGGGEALAFDQINDVANDNGQSHSRTNYHNL